MCRVLTGSLIVLLAVLITIPLTAQDKKKKRRRQQPPQIRSVLKKLEQVDLTEEQSAQIKKLTAEHSPKIKAAQEKLGDGQRTIAAARKKATAEGKKGRQVQAAIRAELTEEQQAAWRDLQAANRQFRAAVIGLLTAEQREKAGLQLRGAGGKKKAKKKAGRKKNKKKQDQE